jgi:hypothetical protein
MLVTSIAYSQNPDNGDGKATPGTLEELIEKKSSVFKLKVIANELNSQRSILSCGFSKSFGFSPPTPYI